MSTNSNIGYVDTDKDEVVFVYCHWDGHPTHVGKMLLAHYNIESKARELVKLGSLSGLYPKLAPEEGQAHTFAAPAKDVTIAYHRDRKEDWKDVKPSREPSFRAKKVMCAGPYAYLFKDDKWYFKVRNGDFQPLTPEHCKEP
jgi:hypothetical protein